MRAVGTTRTYAWGRERERERDSRYARHESMYTYVCTVKCSINIHEQMGRSWRGKRGVRIEGDGWEGERDNASLSVTRRVLIVGGRMERVPTKLAEFVRVCVLGASLWDGGGPSFHTSTIQPARTDSFPRYSPSCLRTRPPHPSIPFDRIGDSPRCCSALSFSRFPSRSLFLAVQRERGVLCRRVAYNASSLPSRASVAFGRLPTRFATMRSRDIRDRPFRTVDPSIRRSVANLDTTSLSHAHWKRLTRLR